MKEKLAICMSGSLRSFDYCKESIKKNIIESNTNNFEIKLFMFIPKDDHCHKIEKLDIPGTIFEIKEDEIIKYNNKIINTQKIEKKDKVSKGGLQGYLQQLKGINNCFQMMEKYEKENNTSFDFIIRIRPDIIFKKNIDLTLFQKNLITVPVFHSHRGINDRFAFGNRENMTHYMNMYPNILKKNVRFFNAECYCKINLDNNKIEYDKKNILFNRVRSNNKILRDSF